MTYIWEHASSSCITLSFPILSIYYVTYTVWWEVRFRGTKFSRIGHWQRLRENVFAVRWSQSHAHTGCMLTTPTSHVKVQWWRASLVLKRWCVDTILMKISGPRQRVSDIIDIGRQLDIALSLCEQTLQHALHSRISQNNGGQRYFRRQGASRIW